MNNLINDIFGDPFITLECESGECMYPSMVPGYVVSPRPLPCDPAHHISLTKLTGLT